MHTQRTAHTQQSCHEPIKEIEHSTEEDEKKSHLQQVHIYMRMLSLQKEMGKGEHGGNASTNEITTRQHIGNVLLKHHERIYNLTIYRFTKNR